MAIEKPAATPRDFLEGGRRDVLMRYLAACKALDDSKFPKGSWDYLWRVLNARVEKAFEIYVDKAHDYWGRLEVEEALRDMGSRYRDLVGSYQVDQFRRELESEVVMAEVQPKQLPATITSKHRKGGMKKK